jgi:hypothetical protein
MVPIHTGTCNTHVYCSIGVYTYVSIYMHITALGGSNTRRKLKWCNRYANWKIIYVLTQWGIELLRHSVCLCWTSISARLCSHWALYKEFASCEIWEAQMFRLLYVKYVVCLHVQCTYMYIRTNYVCPCVHVCVQSSSCLATKRFCKLNKLVKPWFAMLIHWDAVTHTHPPKKVPYNS